MNLPESWTERLPFLAALEEDWEPVPRAVFGVAVGFYAVFLLQAAQGAGFPRWMDLVFIPIHEGGHLLFRFFGEFVAVAGGTLLQLGLPLMLASYFVLHRQVQGAAFCTFFFFEQMLPISVMCEIPHIVNPVDEKTSKKRAWLGWAAAAMVLGTILVGSAISYLRG